LTNSSLSDISIPHVRHRRRPQSAESEEPSRPEGGAPARSDSGRPRRRAAGQLDRGSAPDGEDFRHLDIDVLGISGGDGTNHVTITGFLDVYGSEQGGGGTTPTPLPQIAFLRGGTMNTVANSVGIQHGKPEGLLSRLARAYAERATLPSPTSSVA